MVKEINSSDFNKEVLEQQVPVLVDFWAPWCGPCRMMAPILEDVSKNFGDKVKILKVNTDENQDLAADNQISGIPCLILYKNGKEIDRFVGVQPAQVLEKNLNKHL